jgi:hypothetical protein
MRTFIGRGKSWRGRAYRRARSEIDDELNIKGPAACRINHCQRAATFI